jgi:arsenate reductase (glutaredoxin)
MAVVLYGIPNCDTVKKARVWLDAKGLAYTFHDFKKAGINAELLEDWLAKVGWETLVNRKGTTWRNLSEDRKASVIDTKSASALMLESPSIIKRPVLAMNDRIHVGFTAETYQQLFEK